MAGSFIGQTRSNSEYRQLYRVGGQRRYDESIVARLDVIRLCKAAGFALDEIQLLFANDARGRPASRARAETKRAEIDTRIAEHALHLPVDRRLHGTVNLSRPNWPM